MSDNGLDIDVRDRRNAFELALSTSLPMRGVTAISGASGAGKSSLLRLIAGFDQPAAGCITWGGERWFDSASGLNRPAHQRPVGFMFQDARLFSHLDTTGNLEFAQRRADPDGPDIRMADVVEALDLDGLLNRRIQTLSGGETQRITLARTLLVRPQLLLLDEPLAALDAARKAEILPYLQRVFEGFAIPALYVSHSMDEIIALADRILVLQAGQILTEGSVGEVLDRLDTDPGTGLFDAGVLVTARLTGHDADLQISTATLGNQVLSLPRLAGLKTGERVRLRIRARDVAIATQRPEGISIRNILEGRISEIRQVSGSAFADLRVDIDGTTIRSRLTRASVAELGLETGQPVYALVKSVSFDSRLD